MVLMGEASDQWPAWGSVAAEAAAIAVVGAALSWRWQLAKWSPSASWWEKVASGRYWGERDSASAHNRVTMLVR